MVRKNRNGGKRGEKGKDVTKSEKTAPAKKVPKKGLAVKR